MNTPAPYEVTIAAKLEQLPVPNMMDSIWASIEMQLDADQPLDDEAKSPSQNNPAKGMPGMGKGFYLFIVTVVIITIVLIYKANQNNRKKNITTPVPAQTEIITPVADSVQRIDVPAEKNTTLPIVTNKKDSTVNAYIPGNRIRFDSLNQQPLSVNKPDSSTVIKNKPLLPSFDSIPPPPLIKPKGVKGITNDDYRIQEGKKDSIKKDG